MKSVISLALLSITLASFSFPAEASTFCLTGIGLTPQCYYDDAAECQKNARPPDLACVVNNSVTLSYFGGQRYCIVSSEKFANCLYDDRALCAKDASRARQVCIDRTDMPSDKSPYKYDSRLQGN